MYIARFESVVLELSSERDPGRENNTRIPCDSDKARLVDSGDVLGVRHGSNPAATVG